MHHIALIRRQVVVPVGPDLAFAVFADEIGAWWPMAEGLSVFGDSGQVAVRQGRIVESGPDGEEAVWGSVVDWEPPRRLRLTWHPGQPPESAGEVEVAFAPVADGRTLVTLEQRGPAEDHSRWPAVLERYEDLAAQNPVASLDEDPVWLVLHHTPGSAVADGARIFAHPDFPEHLAFLRHLRDEGVLIAAGPLGDQGEGMAVVRLPDPSSIAELVRRAQDDDLSVARRVLQVQVRAWPVAISGYA